MSMNMSFDFKDLVRLQTAIARMGDIPQRTVTRAASKGMDATERMVRGFMPAGKTEQLSMGLIRVKEKSRKKGKRVYEIAMDPSKNDIFQKSIPANPSHPGKRRTHWKHAYYPASIEYGFLTRSTGGGIRYVRGQHNMRDGAEASRSDFNAEVIRVIDKALEKGWKKK